MGGDAGQGSSLGPEPEASSNRKLMSKTFGRALADRNDMESPPVDAGAPAAGGGAGGGLASRLMKSALSQALSGRRESENKAQEEATRARLAEEALRGAQSELEQVRQELERTRAELATTRAELNVVRNDSRHQLRRAEQKREIAERVAAKELEKAKAAISRTRAEAERELIRTTQEHFREIGGLQRSLIAASVTSVANQISGLSREASCASVAPSAPTASSSCEPSRASSHRAPKAAGGLNPQAPAWGLPRPSAPTDPPARTDAHPPTVTGPAHDWGPTGASPGKQFDSLAHAPLGKTPPSVLSASLRLLEQAAKAQGTSPGADAARLHPAASHAAAQPDDCALDFQGTTFSNPPSPDSTQLSGPPWSPARQDTGAGIAAHGIERPQSVPPGLRGSVRAGMDGGLGLIGRDRTSAGEVDATQASSSVTALRAKYCLDDFDILCVLGQGAFGKVFQVRRKDDGKVFAMKVMRKDHIIERDHAEYIRTEKAIMTRVVHPYIVTLKGSFQTDHKLYLILDFVNGGHLFFQLRKQGTFSEDLCRLYAAELVLALAHLHSMDIVHRDLKPENVLLDNEGHIRVTDFGLAKPIKTGQRSNSLIGTMEYMAPEILKASGHGKEVDWWSLGVLVFEMLTGLPPFQASANEALKKKVLTQKVKMPAFISKDARSLLTGLLTRDPDKRLGFGPSGAKEIMAHPFFKGVNWNALLARQIPSPFTPQIANSLSVENFSQEFTSLPPQDSPGTTPTDNKPTLGKEDPFLGFSYTAPAFLDTVASVEAARGP